MNFDYSRPFVLEQTPQLHDIDGLHHTNNAVYVRWCEQAAWAHSASLGLGLDDYRRLDRAMTIMLGEYEYLLPTRLGDMLTMATWIVVNEAKVTMERRFQLVRHRDNATVLRARWQLACIQMSNGRVRRLPPEFIAAYSGA